MATVTAIDAAQTFDFEHKMAQQMERRKSLKIGIIGFGNFGQFIARRLIRQGHSVLGTSRTPYHNEARAMGAEFRTDIDDFCEEHPDVVVLASSILSTENVLRGIPLQRLKRSTLFVDVLSVKVFPKQLMLQLLPPEMDILCTHPMFGPDSGRGSWNGLNFIFERVRVGGDACRQARCDAFLEAFRREGCRMVEMSCEEHDRQAASTQFITHTVGRVLGAMQLRSTEVDTRGYEALLNLVNNTAHDSFDLYYGLFLYNQNATDELERLEQAFDHVKKQLFGRLHDIARSQIMPSPPPSPIHTPQMRSPSPHPPPASPSPPPASLPQPAPARALLSAPRATLPEVTVPSAPAAATTGPLEASPGYGIHLSAGGLRISPTSSPGSSSSENVEEAAARPSLTAELLSAKLQAATRGNGAAPAARTDAGDREPVSR